MEKSRKIDFSIFLDFIEKTEKIDFSISDHG